MPQRTKEVTLEQLLAKLRDIEREALFLHVVEGYSAVEIAALTGRPRGSVLSLIHRGLKETGRSRGRGIEDILSVMENLDQELKNYYRSQRLSPQQVAAIQGLTLTRPPARAAAYPGSCRLPRACCWPSESASGGVSGMHGSPTQRVVAEIVRNHRQQGPLLVESPRYDLVQAALSDLDFPIRPGRDELVQAFALMGGKYCTIQDDSGGATEAEPPRQRHHPHAVRRAHERRHAGRRARRLRTRRGGGRTLGRPTATPRTRPRPMSRRARHLPDTARGMDGKLKGRGGDGAICE